MEQEHNLSAVTTRYEFDEKLKQLGLDYALKDSERELFRKRWEAKAGHQLSLEELGRHTETKKAEQESEREIREGSKRSEIDELRHKQELLEEQLKYGLRETEGTLGIQKTKTELESEIKNLEHQAEIMRDKADLEQAQEAAIGAIGLKGKHKDLEFQEKLREVELAKKMAELEEWKKDKESSRDNEKVKVRGSVISGMSNSELATFDKDPAMADRLVRLQQVQSGQQPSFEPGPYNQSFEGFPNQPLSPGPSDHPGMTGQHAAYGNPYATAVPSVRGAPVFHSPGANVGMSEDSRLQDQAKRMMPAVGLISRTGPEGEVEAFGTGWMMGPKVLATNAHVAQEIIRGLQERDTYWVTFGGPGGSRKTRVTRAVMHPKYGASGLNSQGKQMAVPANDVALLTVEDPQATHFRIATPDKLARFVDQKFGQKVAYLGFPMEGMAGGGVNHGSPAAVFKSGVVAHVTDWWLSGDVQFPHAQLIQHDLGVAGGASGSPLFDIDGDVIGIVSAGNMSEGIDTINGGRKRIPSGVMLNFAQRVDLLGDLLSDNLDYV